jgi:hypothetical protein
VALSSWNVQNALEHVLLTNMEEPGPALQIAAEDIATAILQACMAASFDGRKVPPAYGYLKTANNNEV